MQAEHTFEGWVVRLRPRGAGRFVSGAFLTVWLTCWTAGGVFAWWILLAGAWALFSGQPPEHDEGAGGFTRPLSGSVVAGAFLCVWLAFWTVGEWVAGRAWLRCLAGEDRLLARPDGLRVRRRAGPFGRERFYGRDELRRIYTVAGGRRLRVATARQTQELSDLLRPEEADALIAGLTRELKLDAAGAAREPVLPEGWAEVQLPEGGTALARDPARRQVPARVAAALGGLVFLVAGGLASLAEGDTGLYVLAAIAGGTGAVAGWGALWLRWGRTEWCIEPGRVVEQRRWRARTSERLVGSGLALRRERDSDGDDWWKLELVSPAALAESVGRDSAGRRKIVNVMHDDTEPRQVGEWLAARTGVPLVDLSAEEKPPVDTAQLRAALARTGQVGRWLARRLDG